MTRKHVLILVAIVTGVLVADQVTKYLAVSRLTTALEGQSGMARVSSFLSGKSSGDERSPPIVGRRYLAKPAYHVLDDYWHFRYVENPGAAWGLFANLPDGVRQKFFVGVTLLALLFIGLMYRGLAADQRLLRLSLALVLGGALGNFVDRLARGYVIDFIDWHWKNQPTLRWPTFNVADVAISIGITLMLLDSVLVWLRRRREGDALPSGGGNAGQEPKPEAVRGQES
jgi:signal peptidase II